MSATNRRQSSPLPDDQREHRRSGEGLGVRAHHLRALRLARAAVLRDCHLHDGSGWRRHTLLGGARTLDELRERGLVQTKLNHNRHDPRTWMYRITDAGCRALVQLTETSIMSEIPITASETVLKIANSLSVPAAAMLFQIADELEIIPRDEKIRDALINRGLLTGAYWSEIKLTPTGRDVVAHLSLTRRDSPLPDDQREHRRSGEGPGVRASEVAELRADREALLQQIIELEKRVKAAEAERDAARKDAIEKPAEDSQADFQKRISEMSEKFMTEKARTLQLEGQLDAEQKKTSEAMKANFEHERAMKAVQQRIDELERAKSSANAAAEAARTTLARVEAEVVRLRADAEAAKPVLKQYAAIVDTAPGQHLVETGVDAARLDALQASAFRVLHFQFLPDGSLNIVARRSRRIDPDTAYVPAATYALAGQAVPS